MQIWDSFVHIRVQTAPKGPFSESGGGYGGVCLAGISWGVGSRSIVFDGSLKCMRHRFLSLLLCLFVCIPALAQERRASLFCGASHNYYCTPEQEIVSMRQEQLNRQRSQSVSNQQNMARYLELEQKRRAVLEQELGRINRQFP